MRIPEEKSTDVAIAVSMIDDAYRDRWDVGVLVTEDSDQVPTLQALQAAFGKQKKMVLYIPPVRTQFRGHAIELRKHADSHSNLSPALLAAHQFPPIVQLSGGGSARRPPSWQ